MQIRLIILVILFPATVVAQQIERKIIIENGQYFFTTIDEETQMGTLHTGAVHDALSESKKFAVPSGRNLSEDFNPFSWDIQAGFLFTVSFFDHPLNDRQEALRRIPLESLDEWNVTSVEEIVMEAVDQHLLTRNEPYSDLLRRSNVLSGFHYDAVVSDSLLWMAVVNLQTIRIWNFDGEKWQKGPVREFPESDWLSLLAFGKEVYLASRDGDIYRVNSGTPVSIGNGLKGFTMSDGVFVLDRDENKLFFLRTTSPNTERSLDELMEEFAFELFKDQ